MKRIVLVLLAFTASEATAQSDSARVRADLALALLGYTYDYARPPALYVGKPGGRFDSTFVPAGARVLGGTYNTLLMELPSGPPIAHAAIVEHLKRKGIRDPKANTSEGGFMFGAGAGQAAWGDAIELCHDSTSLGILSRTVPGGTQLHLRYGLFYRGSTCAPDPVMRGDAYQGEIEIPKLRPPAGASTSGGRVGGNSWSSNGEEHVGGVAGVGSTLSVADLLAHYAAELTAAGWIVEPVTATREAGVVVARKTTAKGRPMRAVLTDVLDFAGAHALQIRIDMPARPRAP